MMTILHVSDLHFGAPYVPRVGDALMEAAHAVEPDLVVASGDFTQRAKAREFEQAADYLESMPEAPTVVVPGNHDVPLYRVFERIFSPYKMYRRYIAEELDQVIRTDDARVVALNSTAPLRHITNGRISPSQLDFCGRAFEDAEESLVRIVVAHHHFAPAPDYEGGQVMPRAKRAIDRFTELKVDLVLGGHLHRAYIGNSLDLYPGLDRDHGIIIVQSGTTTSRRGRVREREKNSFNLIRVTGEVIRITHYMYFEDSDGFEPVSRHIFPRSPIAHFGDGAASAGGPGR
ncbi:MAG: metallophosphoesterase family protein [Candidatus Longimicrobiales bacterium M2_2A_002]